MSLRGSGRERLHESASVMSDQLTYPYTLEVMPASKPAGHFDWVIRRHGKLVQRSDRAYGEESDARKRGLNEIEKLLHGVSDRR